MAPTPLLLPLLLPLLALPIAARADDFPTTLRPLVVKYCGDCHDAESRKGGVDLLRYDTERSIQLDPRRWETVARLIRDREMPPPRKPQPTPEERDLLVDGLTESLRDMDYSLIPKDPGPKLLHRLGRLEYNNTVRDLFGIDLRPADDFPADGSGGGGFDNNAGALFLPPILMERYLAAADQVLAAAPAHRLFPIRPGYLRSDRAAAAGTLEYHAYRAYRGPLFDGELDSLLSVYDRARARGEAWETSVRTALAAVLVSPRFLFRVESDPAPPAPAPPADDGSSTAERSAAAPPAAPRRVADFELATRLSYFLWSSTPDDALLAAARAGRLSDPAFLQAEIRRLLADPKAEAFAASFVEQWLGIRRLRTGTAPDRRKFPEYTPEVRDAMLEEPVRFFTALLRENRSLLELVDADYTWVNSTLAAIYGLPGVPTNGWHRVSLPDRHRGGVATMPAVLTLTSYPQRTSPVLRGKWLLEEILGAPPPPPPPNVGGLPPDDQPKEGLTFRQRLEKHRTKPECAACHSRMDPLGFGLENFDPMGRWRDRLGEVDIDASGQFNTGEQFRGPGELKQLLVARSDEFLRNLAEKMLGYALGRGLEYYDVPTVRDIVEALRRNDARAPVLVEAIATSFPFQHRRPSGTP